MINTTGNIIILLKTFTNIYICDIIRENKIFPYRIFDKTESVLQEKQSMDISMLLSEDIKDKLDEQAMHTIRTVVMLEYARCNKLSGEEVIKEFNGR